jgi:pyruvate dehydrogenase E1 component alpha subunit
MPGTQVDGFDFFAVHEAARAAVERARAGGGPSLIEVKFMRFFGHFEGDQQTYRGTAEVQKLRDTSDCLKRFAVRVLEAGQITHAELEQCDRDARALIDEAVRRARSAPRPTEADLLTDVYASY